MTEVSIEEMVEFIYDRCADDLTEEQIEMVLELQQEFLDSNVIDSYVVPNVYQSEDDATVCIVELDFTVAKGINQIHIIANINV